MTAFQALLDRLRLPWNPSAYHGPGVSRPFFEGWYYKLVDAERARPLAVIPGVFFGREPARSHGFVQVVDGHRRRVAYARYPLEDFEARRGRFDVRIGPNRFRADGLELDIDGEIPVSGALSFADLKPWPVSLLSSGYMGRFGLAPGMECYHGVVSLDHRVDGSLDVDGEAVDYGGGRGYTEKDWGKRFPHTYIWLNCNHFGQEGDSLVASIARVPWRGSSFEGIVVGVLHAGRLIRVATYTGARLTALDVDDSRVSFTVEDRHHRIAVEATPAPGVRVIMPDVDSMEPRAEQTLGATVRLRVTELDARGSKRSLPHRAETPSFEMEGHPAALETNRADQLEGPRFVLRER